MFVLGIDPGVSRCGYGAVRREGSGLVVGACGVIRTATGSELADRLVALERELQAVVDGIGPSAVAVERVFFQANARTAMSVGQASGVALLVAARAGIPVVQYTPSEVKMAVTGWGAADKAQMQAMVQALLNLPERPSPPDVADALALAVCHLAAGPLREVEARATAGVRAPNTRLKAAIERALATPGRGTR
jgi:crossover junction endodeoxyribonuclease RuvC